MPEGGTVVLYGNDQGANRVLDSVENEAQAQGLNTLRIPGLNAPISIEHHSVQPPKPSFLREERFGRSQEFDCLTTETGLPDRQVGEVFLMDFFGRQAIKFN